MAGGARRHFTPDATGFMHRDGQPICRRVAAGAARLRDASSYFASLGLGAPVISLTGADRRHLKCRARHNTTGPAFRRAASRKTPMASNATGANYGLPPAPMSPRIVIHHGCPPRRDIRADLMNDIARHCPNADSGGAANGTRRAIVTTITRNAMTERHVLPDDEDTDAYALIARYG